MSEWKECKLGEVTNLVTKGTTPKGGNFSERGVNYIKSEAITHDGRIDKSTFVFIDENTHNNLKRSQLFKDDILFSMAGVFLGKNAMVTEDLLPANTNQALAIIRINSEKALPKYISYFLRQKSIVEFVNNMSGQSAQPNINFEEIKSIPILLPPLSEQKAIASVLSSLDDKIDLLHRQNKILEAMAETLFRQWFVEEADEGWEEVCLEDVAKRITDGAHASPPSTEIGKPMASVKDMFDWGIDVASCRKISEEDFYELVRGDCRPLKDDILIAKDGSYLKHIFVASEDLDLVILSSIAIIRPNGKYHPYLLSILLKLDSTVEKLKNIVTGAVIPRIVLKDFRKFPILLPPQEIQEKALKTITPIMKKCYENVSRIRTLEKLRDNLLPKLMSGEVRVEG